MFEFKPDEPLWIGIAAALIGTGIGIAIKRPYIGAVVGAVGSYAAGHFMYSTFVRDDEIQLELIGWRN